MIRSFPAFWYSWRKQMRALADQGYRTATVDLRGYNLSQWNVWRNGAETVSDTMLDWLSRRKH
jgi:pimeloyl-ACP methyl ester carboxylesterase